MANKASRSGDFGLFPATDEGCYSMLSAQLGSFQTKIRRIQDRSVSTQVAVSSVQNLLGIFLMQLLAHVQVVCINKDTLVDDSHFYF